MIFWISDMLNTSRYASWNLSMNSGLAQMEASAWMNSCWTGNIGNFTPYFDTFGNGYNWLTNPFVALQQTYSKFNNNMFGDFSNIWPFMQMQPNTKTTKKADEDDIYKQKCSTLEKFLENYIKHVKDQSDMTEWVCDAKKLMNKKTDSEYTYENKYKDLIAQIKTINAKNMTDFLINGKNSKLNNKFIKGSLNEIGYQDVVKSDKDVQKLAASVSEYIAGFGDAKPTFNEKSSINGDNILQVLSYYNSSSVDKNLIKALTNLIETRGISENTQNGLNNAINSMVSALISRANDLDLDKFDDETRGKLTTYVGNLKTITVEDLKDSSKRKAFVDNFNTLYKALRIAEAEILTTEFNKQYGVLDIALFDDNKSTSVYKKTLDDLSKEKLGSSVDNATIQVVVEKPAANAKILSGGNEEHVDPANEAKNAKEALISQGAIEKVEISGNDTEIFKSLNKNITNLPNGTYFSLNSENEAVKIEGEDLVKIMVATQELEAKEDVTMDGRSVTAYICKKANAAYNLEVGKLYIIEDNKFVEVTTENNDK